MKLSLKFSNKASDHTKRNPKETKETIYRTTEKKNHFPPFKSLKLKKKISLTLHNETVA